MRKVELMDRDCLDYFTILFIINRFIIFCRNFYFFDKVVDFNTERLLCGNAITDGNVSNNSVPVVT